MDAVTAVSGSGPAYVFLLAEALAQAGAAAGLPPPLAAKLARETVAGSGELLHRSPLDAAVLRENVTSPGGTTAAALAVLMGEDGLAALMKAAVAAATARSRRTCRLSACGRLGTALRPWNHAVAALHSTDVERARSAFVEEFGHGPQTRPQTRRKSARKPARSSAAADAARAGRRSRQDHRGLPGAACREADRADRSCRDRRSAPACRSRNCAASSPRRLRSSPPTSKTSTAPCWPRI